MQVNSIGDQPIAARAAMGSVDQLEQAFLEEMLKYCGPSAGQGDFSGGVGEEQFSSFLNREWAGLMASRMDLGLGLALGDKA